MDVSDDVLRIILERLQLDVKGKLQLMQVSKQFNGVLEDMFARQKKLSIRSLGKPSMYSSCLSGDRNHGFPREDSVRIDLDVFPCCSYRIGFKPQYKGLRYHSKEVSALIWLLNKCKNLQVLAITKDWGAYSDGIQCFRRILEVILPLASEKLCCLSVYFHRYRMSTRVAHYLQTRSLVHLTVGRITDAAKKLLEKNNPDIVIKSHIPYSIVWSRQLYL